MRRVEEDFNIIFGKSPDWTKIVQEADRDGDGKVDLDEFILIVSNKSELLLEENLKKAFDEIDIDKNGTIDKEEMKEALYSGKQGGKQQFEYGYAFWNKMIEDIDLDGDGKIDYNEFKLHCLQMIEVYGPRSTI